VSSFGIPSRKTRNARVTERDTCPDSPWQLEQPQFQPVVPSTDKAKQGCAGQCELTEILVSIHKPAAVTSLTQQQAAEGGWRITTLRWMDPPFTPCPNNGPGTKRCRNSTWCEQTLQQQQTYPISIPLKERNPKSHGSKVDANTTCCRLDKALSVKRGRGGLVG